FENREIDFQEPLSTRLGYDEYLAENGTRGFSRFQKLLAQSFGKIRLQSAIALMQDWPQEEDKDIAKPVLIIICAAQLARWIFDAKAAWPAALIVDIRGGSRDSWLIDRERYFPAVSQFIELYLEQTK
ncbi:MAG: hypothetical protein KBC95_01735, partial [Candidatus Peribacteraceae bacterium]|nr:hypothetical protein [Candidatus Peribacteraceae bacterium]